MSLPVAPEMFKDIEQIRMLKDIEQINKFI